MLSQAIKEGIVGLIVTGAVVGSMEMIQQTVEWKQLEQAVDDALAESVDAITADQLTKLAHSPEGLKILAGYWAQATSQPGAYRLQSPGNRKAACDVRNPNPDRVPAAAAGKIVPVEGGDSILAASGLSYVPEADASDLGVGAWLVKAVAEANCYSPSNAERYYEQGQASCADSHPGSVAWVAAAAAQQADRIIVAGRNCPQRAKPVLCRASVGREGGHRSGWVSGDQCVIGWKGREIKLSGYRVLVADPGTLKLVQPDKKTAVQAEVVVERLTHLGNDGSHYSATTRMCSITIKDRYGMLETAPGWIEEDGECHAGWNGKELTSKEYVLLVAGEAGMQ